MPRSLLTIDNLTDEDLSYLLHSDMARAHVPGGGSVALIFNEYSTRTRASFHVAAHNVGLSALHLDPVQSSMSKGETLEDTCVNLGRVGVRAIVLRDKNPLRIYKAAKNAPCPVINAGNGKQEHPTQALGDALTLLEHFKDLKGLRVAIVGDVRASRVAHSNTKLLHRLGAEVWHVDPQFYSDVGAPWWEGISRRTTMDEAVSQADVLMMLRWQGELHRNPACAPFYLRETMLSKMQSHTMIMHPGPVIRGAELDDVLTDGHRSLIGRQVEKGVQMRERVLHWALTR